MKTKKKVKRAPTAASPSSNDSNKKLQGKAREEKEKVINDRPFFL